MMTEENMTDLSARSEKIRNGLFLASSRTYGEQYIEPLIREKFQLGEPLSNDHDAVDSAGIKYEIKACKVLSETQNGGGSKSLYERVLFENDNLETSRLVAFKDRLTTEYLANIQNVKRDHFTYLFYVLLFEDCIKVFKCHKDDIDSIPRWSGKHGRYDALGKSGQFGITKASIKWHLDNKLITTILYSEATKIFKKLSATNDI